MCRSELAILYALKLNSALTSTKRGIQTLRRNSSENGIIRLFSFFTLLHPIEFLFENLIAAIFPEHD